MQGMAWNKVLLVMIINKDKLTDYSKTVTYVTEFSAQVTGRTLWK